VLLWLLSSCAIPLFQDKNIDVHHYLQREPVAENDYFVIYHLPDDYNHWNILTEMTNVAKKVRTWLGIDPPASPVRMMIFSTEEPDGQHLLKRNHHRHKVAGLYRHNNRVLLATGQATNPRFLTVLRHEAAHAALHDLQPYQNGNLIPFWLDEGTAALFESEINIEANNERLTLLHYHLAKGRPLDFQSLIDNPTPRTTTGILYARSWGLVACLYFSGRPVKLYLDELFQHPQNQSELFRKILLANDESLEMFETTCRQWLIKKLSKQTSQL